MKNKLANPIVALAGNQIRIYCEIVAMEIETHPEDKKAYYSVSSETVIIASNGKALLRWDEK